MITSKELYDAVQLAEASYTLFDAVQLPDDGIPLLDTTLIGALQNDMPGGGFASAQAQALAASWSLVSHRPDTESGFSASVFQEKGNSSSFVLAIRGTEFSREPIADLVQSDLAGVIIDGIAIDQIVDLYNYWKELTTTKGEIVREARIVATQDPNAPGVFTAGALPGAPAPNYRVEFFDRASAGLGVLTGPISSLTVTGHSLGGHLATAFQRLFPQANADIVTVNGMGTGGTPLVNPFFDALAETQNTAFDNSRIANVFGSAGPELAAGQVLYTQQGVSAEIFTESASFGTTFGHGVEQMTDSAAVYDLFVRASSTLQTTAPAELANFLADVFKAASPTPEFTLESLVNLFGRLFVSGYQNISAALQDDRDVLYQRIAQIRAQLPQGGLTIDRLVGTSAGDLALLAQSSTALAYRYALKELNPFALVGDNAIYDVHNPRSAANVLDGPLDLYVPSLGSLGGMSTDYIGDRAKFLRAKNLANLNDTNSIQDLQTTDSWRYIDRPQDYTVTVAGVGGAAESTLRLAIFGGDGPDDIKGGNRDDHLYGGGGDDALVGGDGNDYLEDFSGLDFLEGDAGDDTLSALDGEGGDRLRGGAGFDTYYVDFGDSVADTPEANAGAIFVGPDKIRLTGGHRNQNDQFFTSADGQFIYFEVGQGLISVREVNGTQSLTIEMPTAPVPGFVDDGNTITTGRPDLGISLVTTKDDKPHAQETNPLILQLFTKAINWRPKYDPLALDLSGDGFQTVGDLGGGTVLFDHDGDGVRSGTGWLANGSDGWLVLDRDGDGLITNGNELFGVNTVLPDGTKALDGFDAIRVLDTNHDGKVDAGDAPLAAWQINADVNGNGVIGSDEFRAAGFADLKVWRDTNQNGFSEPSELQSLAQAGITSIGINSVVDPRTLGGGNALSKRGTFTRTDGSTGTSGAIDLVNIPFYREIDSTPIFDVAVASLPASSGTGQVRDLLQAASDSTEVRQSLQSEATGQTRAAQRAGIDDLLHDWADESSMLAGTRAAIVKRPDHAVMVYSFRDLAPTVSVRDAYLNAAAQFRAAHPGFVGPVPVENLPAGWFEAQQSQAYRDRVQLLETMERFVGQTFFNVTALGSSVAYSELVPATPTVPAHTFTVNTINGFLDTGNWQFLQDAYKVLQDTAFGSVVSQTRLAPYVLAAMAGVATHDFSGVEAMLNAKRAADPVEGLADIIDLGRYLGTQLVDRGWINLPEMIGTWSREAVADPTFAASLADLNIKSRDNLFLDGGIQGDVLLGTNWVPNFFTTAQNTIDGHEGNDIILGGSVGEQIRGGAGDDIIDVGTGGKLLMPGLGRDTILFGRGAGAVNSQPFVSDPVSPADRDVLQFLPGIAPGDVVVRKTNAGTPDFFGSLTLSIIGTNDKFTDNFFAFDPFNLNGPRTLDEVRFADGTVWNFSTILLKSMEGTDADDNGNPFSSILGNARGYIHGYMETNDFIDGKAGNDFIDGSGGNDTLIGGEGDDILTGGEGVGLTTPDDDLLLGGPGNDELEGVHGSDTLDGGTGDDSLFGGMGVDYYILSANSGHDFISPGNAFFFSNETFPEVDVIRADASVNPAQVRLQRSHNFLRVFVDGTTTQMQDSGNPLNPDYAGETFRPSIGRIEFADGTVWDSAQIRSRALQGSTEGNDSIYGYETSNDVIHGGGGDDALDGGNGADQLFGDAGNDNLTGGLGNDTLDGGTGDDFLSDAGGSDLLIGGDGNDNLSAGVDGNTTLDGGAGDDNLSIQFSTRTHDNVLLGGAGNDTLSGSIFHADTLDGGAGDDFVSGQGLFLFGRGSGHDQMSTIPIDPVDVPDTLRFVGLNPGDVRISRTGDTLHFQLVGSDDSVDFSDGRINLARVEFADGTVWDQQFLQSGNIQDVGTEFGDFISEGSGDDFILGLGGNDFIQSGEGNDTLDGGTGADTLFGGAGDDLYIVDDPLDIVSEAPAEGNDTVQSSVAWALGQELENLTLTGVGNISGGGNSLNNVLVGNAGNNLLSGAGGADSLDGGTGNDFLVGGEGDDTLRGGLGDDTLFGNGGGEFSGGIGGSDVYIFARGDGHDLIADAKATADQVNVLRLQGIVPTDVVVQRDAQGNLSVLIGGDRIDLRLTDTAGLPVSRVEFADGTVWSAADLTAAVTSNHAPVAVADSVAVNENATTANLVTTLLSNDTDVDAGDTRSVTAVNTAGTIGSVAFNAATQSLTYSANAASQDALRAGQAAGDSFTYTIADAAGATSSATVSVTVTGVNDGPVANADTITVAEGATTANLVATVLANDTDVDAGDTRSVTAVNTTGAIGTVAFNAATQSLTYSANAASQDALRAGQTATDSFTYTIADAAGATSTATVTMTITGVNDAPVAVANSVSVNENATTANLVPTLLANDTDVDAGDTRSVTAVNSTGAVGTVAFNAATQSLTYSANAASQDALRAGQTATDSFTYTIADAAGATSTATVSVTVSGVNDGPVANADAITVAEGATTANLVTTLLGNDTDVDAGDARSVTAVNTTGTIGTVAFNAATQSLTYSANAASQDALRAGQTASDSFTYAIADAAGATSTATVTMTVTGVNDAPILANQTATQNTTANQAFNFVLPANTFTDVDTGDTLTYSATLASGAVLPSWLTFNATTRTLSGTPANADIGTISVKVVATDTQGATASDVFGINVANAANHAPVANADATTVTEGATTANLVTTLLANDTDVDAGDTRSVTAVNTTGTIGTVAFNAATQSLTYSANAASQDALRAGQTASDSFTYTIADAAGATSTATVNVTVTGVNDAPVLANQTATQNATANQAFSFVLPANTFTDVDAGDTLTYSATLASGAVLPTWLTFNATTRTFTGTPAQGDVGTASVKVTATDTQGAIASDLFSVSVAAAQTGIVGTAGNDTLTGTAGADNISGLAGNDSLNGGAGNDTLDGGTGNDTMVGGTGNDTYVVDSSSDVVTENASAGTDTVLSSVSYFFDANVENVTLTGISASSAWGNALNNVLTGNSAGNVLDGGAGADTMIGGLGDDSYTVDNVGDVVTENANEGLEFVSSSITYTLGANLENLTLTGTSAINGTGNALDNRVFGNSGNNALTGGAGNDTLDGSSGGVDTMVGGTGDDLYIVGSASDVLTENANEGTDTVQANVSWTLGANFENLTLPGGLAINGTGNALNNVLTGGTSDNTLNGGAGADTMIGGAGNDTYVVDNVADVVTENANEGTDTVQTSLTYTLSANVENLTLTGASAINGTGNALDNVLTGNSAANTLTGGLGNDTYVVGAGDIVVENANEGIDTIQTALSYTLGANFENLTLTGTSAINGTGNALDNMLTGNSAANVLTGGAGNDTYIVGTGDTLVENANEGIDTVQSSVTWTLGANFENLTLTGTSAINGTGNALDNVLTGNSAANTLTGGGGNDTYFISSGDTVVEATGAGTDTVVTDITYTLGANLENLTLLDGSPINATGNALNNVLTANSYSNTLDGGAGADTMVGGLGGDTYVVDNVSDVVTENANEGTDTVQSSVTYTLGANLENLTLTGTSAINGTGNAADNYLQGNAAANILIGGLGNDNYGVDNVDDVVIENANEGIDTVQSTVTWTLGGNFENLMLGGSAVINGTGNDLDNTLTSSSNGAANVLSGGRGNDTYHIAANDTVIENAGEGIDLVILDSAGDYTLSANVENLDIYSGTGTGNDLDNVLGLSPFFLVGFATITLRGLGGNDTLIGNSTTSMFGGTGDDTYILGSASNVVTENANEGNDTIQSSFTLALSANVENLILTGTTAISGTGNTLNNLIRGNIGNNILDGAGGYDALEGGAGDDTLTDTSGGNYLNGGAGTDTLTGGTSGDFFIGGTGNDTLSTGNGADVIAFNAGDGLDAVNPSVGTDDTLSLGGSALSYANLTFQKTGNNLILNVSASDSITLTNWYSSSANHNVLNLQVVAEAMSGFNPGGGNPLLDNKLEEFNFQGLVGAFDTARAANPTLTTWALTNALTQFQLAGSDTAALGGDLAYYYGLNGTVAGIGFDKAQDVVTGTGFGTQAQTLHTLASLQDGVMPLS